MLLLSSANPVTSDANMKLKFLSAAENIFVF